MTNTLQVESREALQNWMEALWQLFFDMSKSKGWPEPLAGPEVCVMREGGKCGGRQAAPAPDAPLAGQWKHCCDEVMKIETPAPRKPPQALAKQGSLYHEMGKSVGGLMGSGAGDLMGIQAIETEKAQRGPGPTQPYCIPLFLSTSENHLYPSSKQTPKSQPDSLQDVYPNPSFLFPSVHVDSCLLF